MGNDDYMQRTVITKTKRDDGKVKRWIVNPVFKIAGIEKGEDKKKERLQA